MKSRNFFEQKKGRGVRVVDPTDFQAVTTDARAKDYFVIVDCDGVTERELANTGGGGREEETSGTPIR